MMTWGAAGVIFIGNDIVDLTDPRCRGKAEDTRFMSRIFTPSEVEVVDNAIRPDQMVWALWAAKEAAFKVVSKLLGAPPPFTHARFVTGFDEGDPRTGTVRFGGLLVSFKYDSDDRHIHLVAWGSRQGIAEPRPTGLLATTAQIGDVFPGLGSGDLEALRESSFTDRERPAVHSLASAAVRVAARAGVAEMLSTDPGQLEIVCDGPVGRAPPRLWLREQPANADVSLSHHGDWIAWAALEGPHETSVER